ncbi:MAG: phosphoribosylanthranilate isomerase [Limisphaerales bacterium]|nr:MAG: phosphoribosylanthranilate isomerase [Limisphaerales bacterium]KAG0509319.1 MAG: phosphoribosylanthranilate isomerase [Limisphaerales bacterium]TXT52064.1 MAG: phosphoribosylanthranilate isomerase [Limisphaerales bacterium]
MRTKVKICGLTRLPDALAAVEAGADALGFMFFEGSKRFLQPADAAQIIRALPPFVAKVGVFVNASADTVRATVAECGLDTLQFHGEETPAFCRQFAPLKVVKAFRVQNAESLRPLPDYAVDAWLLDSHVPGQRGGTGEKFNWDLACQAKELGRPVILAGGLTSENVADAVQQVWPFGVDVSSGVESAPGQKDAGLVRRFVAIVREMEQELG